MSEDKKEVCCTKPFLQSAWETAKQVASKPGFASEETIAKRLEICGECPHLDQNRFRCTLCGCKMKLKVRAKGVKCPDKPPRWEAEP